MWRKHLPIFLVFYGHFYDLLHQQHYSLWWDLDSVMEVWNSVSWFDSIMKFDNNTEQQNEQNYKANDGKNEPKSLNR